MAARARTVGRADAARKAVETKTARLRAAVDAIDIRVERLPLDEVRRAAIQHFNGRRRSGTDQATESSAEDFLSRITVNFIRHEMTVYDRAVASLWARTGKREALDLLRSRIYDAIAEAYPNLAEECRAQEFGQFLGNNDR